jgi:hypothetical protein
MTQIIMFAGTKQSGKSTAAKYLAGKILQANKKIRFFKVDEKSGNLLVNTYVNDNGEVKEGVGVLDLYRQDYEFLKYASENIWPYIKIYSFAKCLKETTINVFGLNPQYIYGSDEDKQQFTMIRWNRIQNLLSNKRQEEIEAKLVKDWNLSNKNEAWEKYLTHRELLQEFGTICRAFDSDCWVNACFNQIKTEGYPYAIIDDCRYENEVDKGIKEEAHIALLGRQPYQDTHMSEQIHSVNKKKFNNICPSTLDFDTKNKWLDDLLYANGWLSGAIS